MKLIFLEIAQLELDQAVIYYDHESPGLGRKFLDEVLRTLERISRYPEAWHPISKRTRRALVRGFPYGVIYQWRDDHILIVALAHLHREPEYWKKRLGP
ncbi:MAG: type II toxin-antitoxin system RelE/ParE family toxin [Desulfacinum sp.]|nr:type II toxin-antitoxin system RelE/ParE family toxin [Desulfacinum sp.]